MSRLFRIVYDPGHGGANPGAVGPTGLREADVVLRICKRAKQLTDSRGFESWLTRDGTEKRKPTLKSRWQLANRKDAVLISVHLNSCANPMADYTLVRRRPEPKQDQQLAACLLRRLTQVTGKPGHLDHDPRGQSIIEGANHSACITEPCFISHPERESWLRLSQNIPALAGAIAQGCLDYERILRGA
jgi:N-acetylmuramoyl-L-alanine amidase